MIAEFAVQDEFWSVLPRDFPTIDGTSEEEWLAAFISLYASIFGEPGVEVLAELNRIVAEARQQILPDDVATLLFRPLTAPVTSVAHIQLFDVGDADVSALVERALLPEIDLALAPAVAPFETEFLGAGTKAVFLAEKAAGAAAPQSGLSYAFALRGHVVRVVTMPTHPTALGLMEEPLDEVVRRIRLVDGELPGVEQLGRQEHGESSPL